MLKAFSDAAQTAQPKIHSKQRLDISNLRQRGAERCDLCNCLDRQAIRPRKNRNSCVCCTALRAHDVHRFRRVKAAPRQFYWVKWIERCMSRVIACSSTLGPAGSAELARISSLPRAAAGNKVIQVSAEPLGGVWCTTGTRDMPAVQGWQLRPPPVALITIDAMDTQRELNPASLCVAGRQDRSPARAGSEGCRHGHPRPWAQPCPGGPGVLRTSSWTLYFLAEDMRRFPIVILHTQLVCNVLCACRSVTCHPCLISFAPTIRGSHADRRRDLHHHDCRWQQPSVRPSGFATGCAAECRRSGGRRPGAHRHTRGKG